MIKVEILRKNGNICEFKLSGHAGYLESGRDIVCSAVSLLVINTINCIERLTDCEITCSGSENDNFLFCKVKDVEKHDGAGILLDTMVIGLNNVKQEYNKYILISDKEV